RSIADKTRMAGAATMDENRACPAKLGSRAAEPVGTRAIFVSVEVSLRGTPRRRENRGGLPADADVSLVVGGRDSVWRRGPTAGSRTVATSTPVRVPVPTGLPGSPSATRDGRRTVGASRPAGRGRRARTDRGTGRRD